MPKITAILITAALLFGCTTIFETKVEQDEELVGSWGNSTGAEYTFDKRGRYTASTGILNDSEGDYYTFYGQVYFSSDKGDYSCYYHVFPGDDGDPDELSLDYHTGVSWIKWRLKRK